MAGHDGRYVLKERNAEIWTGKAMPPARVRRARMPGVDFDCWSNPAVIVG
jgi:hypothetical protein